jgi:hypothetical protein
VTFPSAEAVAVETLFAASHPTDGLISATVAAGLLAKSGLPKPELRNVWTGAKTAGPGVAGNGAMDLAEFAIACQLCVTNGGVSPAAITQSSVDAEC